MTNETDETTETGSIALIRRKCDSCGAEAVPLEGIGVDCEACESGEYVARTGVETYQVSPAVAEEYREAYPEAVAE